MIRPASRVGFVLVLLLALLAQPFAGAVHHLFHGHAGAGSPGHSRLEEDTATDNSDLLTCVLCQVLTTARTHLWCPGLEVSDIRFLSTSVRLDDDDLGFPSSAHRLPPLRGPPAAL